eukprot:scaffold141140_cov31-Tisochrysis_lutea.AAC.1
MFARRRLWSLGIAHMALEWQMNFTSIFSNCCFYVALQLALHTMTKPPYHVNKYWLYSRKLFVECGRGAVPSYDARSTPRCEAVFRGWQHK